MGVTEVIDRNEPLVREGGRLTGIDSNDSTLFPSPEHRAGTSRRMVVKMSLSSCLTATEHERAFQLTPNSPTRRITWTHGATKAASMGETLNEGDLLTEACLETDSDEATKVGAGSVSTMQVETRILIGDFLSA